MTMRASGSRGAVAQRNNTASSPASDLVRSVISEPRGKHSEKPVAVHEFIDRYYPELPKIELFARAGERPGWSAWGNQSEDGA